MLPDQQIVLAALKQQESGGDPNALSPKGAAGAYQIMPDTARDPGYGVKPLQNWDGKDPRTAPPEEQKRFADDYLAAMAREHGGDRNKALAAYNAGPGAVAQYNGVPPYAETQNYVKSINNMVQPQPQSDWRSRAKPVAPEQPAPQATSDWRSRAKPVQGQDQGRMAARVQGFNSAVPFGERITAGLGAVGAKAYDMVNTAMTPNAESGGSLSDFYKEQRANQAATADANPGEYTTGAVAGLAAQLPLISTKVLTGTRATTGARGAVNAIPDMLSATGNFVRGSKVASNAGTVAKAANLGGKALRSAAVAAPSGAVYSYGASRNDLDSAAAFEDAKRGAKLGAAVGAAVPIAGAGLERVLVPKINEATAKLVQRAKDFGLDLSLDQIAPTRVRNTIQKISQNIPGSGVDNFQAGQRQQWMRSLAKEALGEEADNLGPEVVQNYLSRANTDFESTLAGKVIAIGQKDVNDIADIGKLANRKVNDNLAKVVQNNVNDFIQNLGAYKVGAARSIPGEKLASLRAQMIKDLPNIEGGARELVGDIVDKIDDLVAKQLSPEEVQKLATARYQWRNFRTIEPLLEKSTDGMINPTQLMQRVASSKFIKASRKKTGEDALVDLARIGKQFLPVKEGSDTAQKLMLSGTAATATMAPFAPAIGIPALALQGGVAATNRVMQSGVNRNQALVNRAVKNALPAAKPEVSKMLTGGKAKAIAKNAKEMMLDKAGSVPAQRKVLSQYYKDLTGEEIIATPKPINYEGTFYHGGETLKDTGEGITYFTQDKNFAGKYADNPEMRGLGKGGIQAAKIKITNPADDDVIFSIAEELHPELMNKIDAGTSAGNLLDKTFFPEAEDILKELKKRGYDGAKVTDYHNTMDEFDAVDTFITFNRKNIKPIKE